jgi:hypothetical protein
MSCSFVFWNCNIKTRNPHFWSLDEELMTGKRGEEIGRGYASVCIGSVATQSVRVRLEVFGE